MPVSVKRKAIECSCRYWRQDRTYEGGHNDGRFHCHAKELLSKLAEGGEFDFFREAMLTVLRELMEVEISAKTAASLGERTPERLCR